MFEPPKHRTLPGSPKKEPFFKGAQKRPVQSRAREHAADEFARRAWDSEVVREAFFSKPPADRTGREKAPSPEVPGPEAGSALQPQLLNALKACFGEDFSDVQVHCDDISTRLALGYHAAAVTIGSHIYLNSEIYQPRTPAGFLLLMHELFHAQAGQAPDRPVEIMLKPLVELQDQTGEQKAALERATKIAMGEKGKVNSGQTNEDKTRVGWEYLLEYFRTTMGPDTIVADKKDYKAGKFLEENIKYLKRGKATKIKIVDGKHTPVTEDNVDLLPSWCGIFVFWAYHKAGIHPEPWQLGKPNFTSRDAYKKGEYLPRPGDLVIKNGYNHHAMVVSTDPEQVTNTTELAGVKVKTINGNTAGSNHTGGQIQEKTDPYGYWDFYIRPFFAGVTLTPESEYQADERLQENLGISPAAESVAIADSGAPASDPGANADQPPLEPVTLDLDITPSRETDDSDEIAEAPVSPAEIMAQDQEYAALADTLDGNARAQRRHGTGEEKAGAAQRSAVSPPTEALAKAKADKVEKLGEMPRPKPFNAADLKKQILDEVDRLVKEKENEAARTGDKPNIKDNEIDGIKDKNSRDIEAKRTESIGNVEEAHRQAPDESSVEKRTAADVVPEDPGNAVRVPDTERAVAKPVADERITLEAESASIDQKMAENDVEEQQLAESEEPQFTGALGEKRESQSQAANVKADYREVESIKLEQDKQEARAGIDARVQKIHGVRQNEFGNVDTVKDKTKTADEERRKQVTEKIESIYGASEQFVNSKLAELERQVNADFDAVMARANENFKNNVNKAMDDEFTWEGATKLLDKEDHRRRVAKVFKNESDRYTRELSAALTPLTDKIAETLNAILDKIYRAKNEVKQYVETLEPDLQNIGNEAAKAVMEKFASLEESVNRKQEALTGSLAGKYAEGVMAREEEFKKIMDSRKSWLSRALSAIADAVMEIVNLLADLKRALERAADYASQIIKAPGKFFKNLARGATQGFQNFVSNIGKHLLQGALEWITGEMSEAGIQLPEKFDFKGILSLILQVLGISVQNVMAIARRVIGEKYVSMLEKGADIGVKAADKILRIFRIIKDEGIEGLWEFIKEQFNDLKERLLEEAKTFIITTVIEVAVPKIISMLIPGAGFISAVKSLIDFLRNLFAKARQIVNIITGIIDTFGEILAGNVGKVATMVEGTLARFVGMAISFLASILGLGNIGKKIGDIIQKKIKDPINKAITKIMEKLKALLTRLGVFKFLDGVASKIQQGKDWIDDKKEKAKGMLKAVYGYIKSKYRKAYTEKDGSSHTLQFNDSLELERHSVTRDLGNYLIDLDEWIRNKGGFTEAEKKEYGPLMAESRKQHGAIKALIGKTVKEVDGQFEGADKYFSEEKGKKLNEHLAAIAANLRKLPALGGIQKNAIPKTVIRYPAQAPGGDGMVAEAPLISIDSQYIGSKADSARYDSTLTKNLKKAIHDYKGSYNLVKGHLINHELHGTGASQKNLGPIPVSANNSMLRGFEEEAKQTVHRNGVIDYRTEYIYGPVKIDIGNVARKLNKSPDSEKSKRLVEDLAAVGPIPSEVKYKVEKLRYKYNPDDEESKINARENWDVEKSLKNGSLSFEHEDFF